MCGFSECPICCCSAVRESSHSGDPDSQEDSAESLSVLFDYVPQTPTDYGGSFVLWDGQTENSDFRLSWT
jgi:hypothetical protein